MVIIGRFAFTQEKNAPFGAFLLLLLLETEILKKCYNTFFCQCAYSCSRESQSVDYAITRIADFLIMKINHEISFCTAYRMRDFVSTSSGFSCIDTDAWHSREVIELGSCDDSDINANS